MGRRRRCGGRACHTGDAHILTVELLAGSILVVLVLYDVFETVVIPRQTATRLRISPPIVLLLWPVWRRIGLRITPMWRREDFLGTYAPFVIVLLLVVWVVSLILGFGLVYHALQDEMLPPPRTHLAAFYAAGTALLTIGYGDFVPVSPAARFIALVAGAAGLSVVALVISLTFNLYSSFMRREVLVLLLDPRAGVPPSGVTLLEIYGERHIVGQLGELFGQYEAWTAEMLDSHLAYPVLPFFRSSHDGQSWVSALGAVLDAATLLLSTVEEPSATSPAEIWASRAAAETMYHTGCHALTDLTQARLVPKKGTFRGEPGIERAEFDAACDRLVLAGYRAAATDETWQAFVRRRSVYALRLNALATYLASPPTLWIGDRTTIGSIHQPHAY